MLSVLIPVFNEDVRKLVNDLHGQLSDSNIAFEIRLIDDASKENFREKNKELASKSFIIYTECEKNIGRSAIRNKLASEAKGDWFWFLDCDSQVGENTSLVKLFWQEKSENTILSGGRIYQNTEPDNNRLKLHWLWGSERELLDPATRMKDPVNNFLSNNFIIHKSSFEKVRFDTLLYGYGYEDTLFAAEALNHGISVKHIKNPVIHAGLEPADAFLKKIEESLDNLFRLKEICREKGIPFPVKSKLMLAYNLLRLPVIKQLAGSWFVRNSSIWRIQLLGKNPDLKTFDAYRLAYLLSQ